MLVNSCVIRRGKQGYKGHCRSWRWPTALLCLAFMGALAGGGPAWADLTDHLGEGDEPSAPPKNQPPPPASQPPATANPSAKGSAAPKSHPRSPKGEASTSEAADKKAGSAVQRSEPNAKGPSRPGRSKPSGDASAAAPHSQAKLPVSFQGDGLSGLRQEGMIQLHAKVKVEQGDFKLTADRAQVFFDPQTDEVSRILATGNVRMQKKDPKTGQQVQAKSEQVEFFAADQTIILTGEAELLRGKDLIKSHFIKYEMNSGQVHAGKVKGIVQPGEGQ